MDTVIFKNHPSAALHSDAITNYLTDELKAGRMSGPFSRQHVEDILRGPIFCSPLLVSVQTQQPGTPDKLRVCRHLSKGDKTTPSANSHIHKEDFPTRFDTALKVADIVCLFPPQLEAPFPFFTDPLLVGSLSRDPPLAARPSWDALLVPHLYTGSTSGGSFFLGCTSGAPFLHGIHLWWLVLCGMHFWCPISTRDPLLVARFHRMHFWCSISTRDPIWFACGGSYFMGPLMAACWDAHPWILIPVSWVIFVAPSTTLSSAFHISLTYLK